MNLQLFLDLVRTVFYSCQFGDVFLKNYNKRQIRTGVIWRNKIFLAEIFVLRLNHCESVKLS